MTTFWYYMSMSQIGLSIRNALISINVVTVRRVRLVLGWATVCEQ